MTTREIRRYCHIETMDLLHFASKPWPLARAHDKVLRVARTIADLAGAETIGTQHVMKQFNIGYLTANSGHRKSTS